MATSHISYQGNLQTKNTHLQSGTIISTDAPVDNQGTGASFSPTDLLSTSLASCMITLMGISARGHHFELGKVEAEMTKMMASGPRRVKTIQISMVFPESNYTDAQKEILKSAAISCPVAKSLHPDIHQDITFKFD